MGLYKLVLSKQVRKKDFLKLPANDRLKVVRAIKSLSDNPHPPQARKLTSREEYRLRQGDYRILYVVEDKIRIVEVRRVRHRREVYRSTQ
jgi:mRNA interferase RelE/StbE